MNTQYASTFFAEWGRTCTGTQFLFFYTQNFKLLNDTFLSRKPSFPEKNTSNFYQILITHFFGLPLIVLVILLLNYPWLFAGGLEIGRVNLSELDKNRLYVVLLINVIISTKLNVIKNLLKSLSEFLFKTIKIVITVYVFNFIPQMYK